MNSNFMKKHWQLTVYHLHAHKENTSLGILLKVNFSAVCNCILVEQLNQVQATADHQLFSIQTK
jgi:hypothetical protein